jgi:hypothetical protein
MRTHLMKTAIPMMLAAMFVCGCSGGNAAVDHAAANDSGAGSDDVASDAVAPETSLFPSDDTGAALDSPAAEDTKPACTPSGDVDDPDDDFKDTNCDGIDGDKTRAVFVAPTGSDDMATAGTMDAPLKTIGAAIARAAASKKDVYLCNATYAEQLTIADGVRVFGGYDCKAGWKRTLDRATIAPAAGLPIRIAAVKSPVRFDRIAVRAADGANPGDSSIAVVATDSTDVAFTNSAIKAGNGADGATPEPPAGFAAPATKGADATSWGPSHCSITYPTFLCKLGNSGAATTSTAPACEGHGGKGGDGGVGWWKSTWSTKATAGWAGSPVEKGAKPSVSGEGLPGTPGTNGINGTNAAAGFGELRADGYAATNGGTAGLDGSGGGGGSGGWGANGGPTSPGDFPSEYYNGGAGGEGGFGGCGGTGGKAGGGGGASIGIVAYRSAVTLKKTTVDTSSGGRGGAGASGADGQVGGDPGVGGASTDPRTPPVGQGYSGGRGGKGGKGGNGGAGGGGPSLAIAWFQTAPKTEAMTFNVGTPGAGGVGADGTKAPSGVTGTDGVFEWTPPTDGDH